ncbi:MAG: ACP S-malonyltransferase [Planctomycetes bacterium]|jgi:[acyl-carrier-protein] S-malonyltransferase|nr:ACP S-malonyltransferase [Planctomycetota bacterium]HPY75566.1 ACP S-malonyltransferase [Planctomycetota bacterium]HQB01160.1 ACP S-malonyltransferase [Planctomycetota bacterium]
MPQTNIFMFPGQGSQTEKMGFQLWQTSNHAKETFQLASQIYEQSLEQICFHSPFTELQRTDNAQIAIATLSIIYFDQLLEQNIQPDIVIGHSAGEIAGLYASGILTKQDALLFAKIRGQAMYQAASQTTGKMIAIVNATSEQIQPLIDEIKQQDTVLAISNYNGPLETVVSGDIEPVTQLQEKIKELRIGRAVDLKQQGAWHSKHMQQAQDKIEQQMKNIQIHAPKIPMFFNYDAQSTNDPEKIRKNLIQIITHPVHWTQILEKLKEIENPHFYEVGTKNILGGLLRKTYKDIQYEYTPTDIVQA